MNKLINCLIWNAAVIIALMMTFTAASPVVNAADTKDSAAETEETSENLYEDVPVVKFRVSDISPEYNTEMDYVDWWYSPWEDCHYIFLPSTAVRSKMKISYQTKDGSALYVNGEKLLQDKPAEVLSEGEEFEIKTDKVDCGKLKILQSELGCIYLKTGSTGLDALDNKKIAEETADALMINAKGQTEYIGAIERIERHGNSSWGYSKKKPYNIKLPEKADLYDMGKAKKWVLMSNYLDYSMVRNSLVLEMSRAAGMEYVMDSVYVDLYADGSYRGTYQLFEKIQIQKNRVNITDLGEKTEDLNDKELKEYKRVAVGADPNQYMENSYQYYDIPKDPDDITGGYLLQFQLWNRYKKAKSGFVTSRGQAVQMEGPEYASKAQVLYIREFMQDLEDAIYSDTGYNSKGKHYSDYMDVNSFARAYLIQEISMNVDGDNTSFFMWKESDKKGDGKLHFGPAWDFDFSLNNFLTSRKNSLGQKGYSYKYSNLFAACFPIDGYDEDLTDTAGSNRPTYGVGWMGQMYMKDEFLPVIIKNYRECFMPYLEKLTDEKQEGGSLITQMSKKIACSAEMSNARWHTYGGEYKMSPPVAGENFEECVEFVRNYLFNRKEWLTGYWKNDVKISATGDANLDTVINAADLITLRKHLLTQEKMYFPETCDISHDGKINILDMNLLKRKLLSVK